MRYKRLKDLNPTKPTYRQGVPGSRRWLLTSTAHSRSLLTEINLSYPLKPPVCTLDSVHGYSGCALHSSEGTLPPEMRRTAISGGHAYGSHLVAAKLRLIRNRLRRWTQRL